MKSIFLALIVLTTSFFAFADFDRGVIGGIGSYRRQPSESFRQTCRVVRENRFHIQAYCRTIAGQMVYNDFDRRFCETDIANIDGRLICAGSEEDPNYPGQPNYPGNPGYPGQPNYPAPLPAGSYQRSCQQCQADGVTLSCQCLDTHGQYHFTSIGYQRCGQEIGNLNGQLVCQ
jgi:hypothetical protein